MKPLVSVLIPAYRSRKFIAEALRSVQNQSYPHWEIIVVEDASQDGTESVVRDFAKNLSQKVVYLRHESNRGVPASRNTGVRNSSGSCLAFLDADDLWKENHLEDSLRRLEEEGGELSHATALIFEDGTNKTFGFFGPKEGELDKFPASLYLRNFIPISAVVIRASVIRKIGLFDEGILCGDDLDYCLRSALSGIKFVPIRQIHCLRRKHSQAMTNDERKLKEGKARFYRKYLKDERIPASLRRLETAKSHAAAGAVNLLIDPKRAAWFFSYALKIFFGKWALA